MLSQPETKRIVETQLIKKSYNMNLYEGFDITFKGLKSLTPFVKKLNLIFTILTTLPNLVSVDGTEPTQARFVDFYN